MCKQPTLSKAVDRMEAKGWVTRSLSRQDRRVIGVSIDKAGLKVVRPLLVKARELEELELGGISKKEIQVLKKTLRNLVCHCATRGTLDDSSCEASGPPVQTKLNSRLAKKQRSSI